MQHNSVMYVMCFWCLHPTKRQPFPNFKHVLERLSGRPLIHMLRYAAQLYETLRKVTKMSVFDDLRMGTG